MGSILFFVMVVVLLLILSALMSGSEVAFFSLSPENIHVLEKKQSKQNQRIIELLSKPEFLLATILVTNNLINVGIVILSAYLSTLIFNFSSNPILGLFLQIGIITFFLLLVGEIIPKVYAGRFAVKFARLMSLPLTVLSKIVHPINFMLVQSTNFINKQVQNKKAISINQLSEAFDLAENQINEDRKILQGIVRFGNIDVKEIMKPRIDVVTVDINTRFKKLIDLIIENGYSRLPIVDQSFDSVKGILYIKDILPHINEEDSFDWAKLMRKAYFVPETKMLDDLLEEFRRDKNHLAVVVDEYGGTSGIITLEDILEEIVGEITDEMDEDEIIYSSLGPGHFLFEGKILLNDFYKIVEEEDDYFFKERGDTETLAGLILEKIGMIPEKGTEISIRKYFFKVKSVDNRRIKQVEVKIIAPKKA